VVALVLGHRAALYFSLPRMVTACGAGLAAADVGRAGKDPRGGAGLGHAHHGVQHQRHVLRLEGQRGRASEETMRFSWETTTSRTSRGWKRWPPELSVAMAVASWVIVKLL
jgi:hypothetical protein